LLILLIGRLILAVVFAVAGIAKLADRPGSKQAIVDFGLPTSLAGPLGVLLPLSELAVAAALIPPFTALWGALGALVFLSAFVVGIGVNLVRGRRPDCHCFGQLHSAPAGWKTLARNGILAMLAGILVWQGWNGNVGPSAFAWLGALTVTQVLSLAAGLVLLVLLAGQWWFLLHLLRQNGRLLVRIEALEGNPASGSVPHPSSNGTQRAQSAEGLPVGSEAPNFELKGLYGKGLTLWALRSWGKPLLLLFTDPNCGPCNAMLPEIGRWQEHHTQKLTTVLVSSGAAEENETKAKEHGLKNVVLQEDWEVSEAYRVAGTPSAVLVSAEGAIASPVAGGAEAIENLVTYAVGERAHLPMRQPQDQGRPCPNCGKVHPNGNGSQQQAMPAKVKLGEHAPEVKLADLDGRNVELTKDFEGEETLVVFWNPGCGFCQQMLPDIKEWEENRPEGAPKLLFVSAGTEEENRDMKLSSKVVLGQQFAAGRAFGASGTPSAVLVNAEGNIASGVAVGAPGVLELAGARQAEA
jgi:thiol-disulfide isomerase/thioredoxin